MPEPRRWTLDGSHPITTRLDGPRLRLGERVEVIEAATETEIEPWNHDRPDLKRVGVEAAARALYDRDRREYDGASSIHFEGFQAEFEEEAVGVLRAYFEGIASAKTPSAEADNADV